MVTVACNVAGSVNCGMNKQEAADSGSCSSDGCGAPDGESCRVGTWEVAGSSSCCAWYGRWLAAAAAEQTPGKRSSRGSWQYGQGVASQHWPRGKSN
jgi:hypothetical protein